MENRQSMTSTFFSPALMKRMLTGAGIGLLLVSFFVITAGEGQPSWGAYWRLKPLLLTPLLASIVAACYHATGPLRDIAGWQGRLFTVLSIIGYVLGLWIALILGLNGSLWN